MVVPSTRKARATLVAFVTSAALAVAIPPTASATSASYCGGVYTPAHGWCYYGVPFGWRYVEADYFGGGSFDICAALNNYYSRVTRFKDCRNTVAWSGYAGGCYFGGDSSVDPGVGNTDGNRHTIYGYADNTSC